MFRFASPRLTLPLTLVLVAEWGEPARVDMTFGVTKSFLSAVVGSRTTAG